LSVESSAAKCEYYDIETAAHHLLQMMDRMRQ
jgi:hypothetical protein